MPEVQARINELQHNPEREDSWKSLEPLFKTPRERPEGSDKVGAAQKVGGIGRWETLCWLSERGRLGPLARLILVLECVLKDPQAASILEEELDDKSLLDHLVTELVANADRTRAVWYVAPTLLHRTVARAFNSLPYRRGLPQLSYADIVTQDLGAANGTGEPLRFSFWLRNGYVKPVSDASGLARANPLLVAMHWDNPQVRTVVHHAVVAIRDATIGRPIINIHSLAHPAALTAAALRIADEMTQAHEDTPHYERWPVIWLYASRPGVVDHVLTATEFVRPLMRAFQVQPSNEGREQLSADELDRVLEALRRALTTSRCLVVVEGMRNASGRVAPLFDFLRGNGMIEEILRRLVTPSVQAAQDSLIYNGLRETEAGLCRANVLLLSAQRVETLAPFAELHLPIFARSAQTSDEDTSWRVWFNRSVAHHAPETIAPVCARLEGNAFAEFKDEDDGISFAAKNWAKLQEQLPGEVSLSAYAALIAIRGTGKVHVDPVAAAPIGDKPREVWRRPRHLIGEVIATLIASDRQEELIVLAHIACVPDGIFRESLARISRQWLQLAKLNSKSADAGIGPRLNRLLKSLARSTSVRGKEVGADDFAGTPFFDNYKSILSIELEQVLDHLGPRQLRYEVDSPISPEGPVTSAADNFGSRPQFRRRLVFSNDVVRELFIDAFCAHANGEELIDGFSVVGRQSWRLIEYAVALDTLRQGTALLRNADSADLNRIPRQRRIIQSIYHLCNAGQLGDLRTDPAPATEASQQPLSLTRRPEHRVSMAYLSIYRQVVEGGEWRLTRSWGRSELRAALLLGFIHPGRRARCVALEGPRHLLELDSAETVKSSDGDPVDAFALTFVTKLRENLETQIRLVFKEGTWPFHSRLWYEYYTNLAHAASDAEDHRIADFAVIALEIIAAQPAEPTLSPATAPTRLPIGSLDHLLFTLEIERTTAGTTFGQRRGQELSKLRFDVLDSRGWSDRATDTSNKRDTDSVDSICRQALDALGFKSKQIACVRKVARYLGDLTLASEFDFAKATDQLMRLFKETLATPRSNTQMVEFVDLLARWSDLLANKADAIYSRSKEDKRKVVGAFLEAWVAFWLSDLLRAEVGVLPGANGRSWGRVSSRMYRTGIRTTLKLARSLALPPDEQEITGDSSMGMAVTTMIRPVAAWLLSYAAKRADILARDVFPYERERLLAVLLQASIARTIAAIADDTATRIASQRDDPSELQTTLTSESAARLADALAYVTSAERRLLTLGVPDAVGRRWAVERISVLGDLCKNAVAKDQVQIYETLLERDLKILSGLAHGHPFWSSLYERHRARKNRRLSKSN